MAKAAAKKSAVAKEATAKFYLPLLLVSNVFYVLLLLGRGVPYRSIWSVGGMLVTWGLQGYAYWGILDQAANQSSSSSSSSKRTKALVGGANLDLLALTVAIQYLTVYYSNRWFWLLSIVPAYGGWQLHRTFGGGGTGGGMFGTKSRPGGGATPNADDSDDGAASPTDEKRKKRAQRRQQKKYT